jgi:hypothetical protein
MGFELEAFLDQHIWREDRQDNGDEAGSIRENEAWETGIQRQYYIKELTVGWRHGLSLRAPAKQVRSCEFKPKYRKQNNPPTKKKKKTHIILTNGLIKITQAQLSLF